MPNYKIIHVSGNIDPSTKLDVGQIGYIYDTAQLFIGNGIGQLPNEFLTGDLNSLALLSGADFNQQITCNNNNLYNSPYFFIEGRVNISFNNLVSKNYSLNPNGYIDLTIDSSQSSVGSYLIINAPPNSPISSLTYNGTIYKQKNLNITGVYGTDFSKYRTFYIRYGGNNRIFINMISYD